MRKTQCAATGTLVVVDMQTGYFHANWVLSEVLADIRDAQCKGWNIILLWYETECGGLVLDQVRAAAPSAPIVAKNQEDGSDLVIAAARKKHFTLSHLRVCGVMTDVCVKATANGLAASLPEACIEVRKAACLCCFTNYDWSTFALHPNIELI